MIKGCYTKEQLCNGRMDCDDGYDESDCGDASRIEHELIFRYRMSRLNRCDDFYDNWDGEWGWFDINIDEDREQFETIEVPDTPDDWYFTVFSVSRLYGISVIEQPSTYSTFKPMALNCEAPPEVHRGETIGVQCIISNWTPQDMEVVILLIGSDDYEFVHVEEYGYVVSYNPRTSKGDHHHLIFVRGESQKDVHLPIAPKVQYICTIQCTLLHSFYCPFKSNNKSVVRLLRAGKVLILFMYVT
jgi:CD109 antigen